MEGWVVLTVVRVVVVVGEEGSVVVFWFHQVLGNTKGVLGILVWYKD